YLENIYKPLNAIISASSDWILMIYSSLDSSHRDESNDSKIIPIGAIFVEIAIFAKFRVGSGQVNCLTRPDISGQFGSGTRITGQNSELYSFFLNLLFFIVCWL